VILIDCKSDPGWLSKVQEGVRHVGFAVVGGVVGEQLLGETRAAMYRAQRSIHQVVGEEKLRRAGELGVLRLMMKYEPQLIRLIEIPELLAVVDSILAPTAILHLQNGLILPSFEPGAAPSVFQNRFHMDFPRILNGALMSLNAMLTIDEYTAVNGGTLVVPGTHQKAAAPDQEYLRANAIPVECPPGSMIVFDSTLWHAAGANHSGRDRLAINHQFTRSYVKQQVDYVRALGDELVTAQQPRTQQLLGWYTRVVTSLDEFYRPADERLYRSGQG
jgi:ectoine hydroxylase-related dioxygenase (phytanoyl-CoA dioxygenase family)